MSEIPSSDPGGSEAETQARELEALEALIKSLGGEDPDGPRGTDEMKVVWEK